MRGKSAFTLIELMVVVSIIGIVTALAIPNMNKYKTKAKMAEASIILPSIVKYQKAFYIENGYFKPLEPTARISNNGDKVRFDSMISEDPRTWEEFGPYPVPADNLVYFSYMADAGQVDENGDEVGPLPYPSLFDFDNLEPSRTSPRMFIREFTETGEPCAPSIWEENGAGNLGARTGLSSYDWLIVSAVGNLDGQEINEPEEGDSSCTIFYQVIEHYQGAFSDSPLISLFKGK